MKKIKNIVGVISCIIAFVLLVIELITGSLLLLVLFPVILFCFLIFDFITSLMDYIDERKRNKRR